MCRLAAPASVMGLALLGAACAGQCGARGGLPPARPPLVQSAEGPRYVVTRGRYKAYYDREGRLQRLEHDANGDGHPEEVSHHEGARIPQRLEADPDSDGTVDRWESYDAQGVLTRIGTSRHGKGPDLWVTLGPDGAEREREYDDDGDRRVERRERLEGGVVVAVEADGDRNGALDRWQTIRAGRVVEERLDTDGDGRADRRVTYDAQGQVLGLEILAAR
jgi:hypothetical protein